MADNVTITAGANSTPPNGTIVATDDIGGVHYPYIKMLFGGDGIATIISDASPLPIKPGTGIIFDVDITDDVVTTFDHGAKSGIGTSAVQLIAASVLASRGVIVKASNSNGNNIIYVGNSDVTNGSADTTDGFELSGGESITIPVDDANKVYVIGSIAGLRVSWILA